MTGCAFFVAILRGETDDIERGRQQSNLALAAAFAEMSNGQSSVDARVLLDKAVKLHYKPSSTNAGSWLTDDGGEPFALLDPIMVGNDQRVRFFEHYRVSGASPYITCFPHS